MPRARACLAVLLCAWAAAASAAPRVVPIAPGWARNQINAVIFRRHALVTHGDTQYAAFYDAQSRVVLASRRHGTSDWTIHTTQYRGNTADAHNTISIAVDATGVLHVAWDHHNSRLRYCRGLEPGGLELSEPLSMVGDLENRVTYPEFHALSDGTLLFAYRHGSSGKGNLVMNVYDPSGARWRRLHDRLIDGERVRNAYWQMTVDRRGAVHLSWVWRETPNVSTNHDVCYARSTDGGRTWRRSTGEPYELPITADSAEYVIRVPERHELINQTSMTADAAGRPYIATYFRAAGSDVPQYHVLAHDGTEWRVHAVSRRTTPFTLSGVGSRRIPMSRPLIAADERGGRTRLFMVFRDAERGSRASVAVITDVASPPSVVDLTEEPLGQWEPVFDPVAWRDRGELHLLVQRVGQLDGERLEALPPQIVSVLEWDAAAAEVTASPSPGAPSRR